VTFPEYLRKSKRAIEGSVTLRRLEENNVRALSRYELPDFPISFAPKKNLARGEVQDSRRVMARPARQHRQPTSQRPEPQIGIGIQKTQEGNGLAESNELVSAASKATAERNAHDIVGAKRAAG
jgi:hypothetical protein